MTDQPGLFDVPDLGVAPPARPAGRGRARETYARTAVADVTVQDAAALRAAALQVLDGGIVVELPVGEEVADDAEDGERLGPREEVAASSAAALEWCLEPTSGLWPLLETGAVRVRSVELDVVEKAATQLQARWTVTIQLRDVVAARELALAVCPVNDVEARVAVETSWAAVWQWAAEPYGPLQEVPGITWSPGDVTVEQVMARSR